MTYSEALDIMSLDELQQHVAFLEESAFVPSLAHAIWHLVRRAGSRITHLVIRTQMPQEDAILGVVPSPLMRRVVRRKAQLAGKTREELVQRMCELMGSRAELSRRASRDRARVARAVLTKAARARHVSLELHAPEEIERHIFVSLVFEQLGMLQRCSLAVEKDRWPRIVALLKNHIGMLGDVHSTGMAQVLWAERQAGRALVGLVRSGVVVGALAALGTMLLLSIYAAVSLLTNMGFGLALPAIIVGVLFVIQRRFNEELLAFEVSLLHARIIRHQLEKGDVHETTPHERELVSLKHYVEDLTSLLKEAPPGRDVTPSREELLARMRIVVLGEGHVGTRALVGIAKEHGLAKAHLEHIGFEKLKHYNVERLRWGAYDGIIVAEVPHSAKGTASANLVLYLQGEGFPPSEVCRDTTGEIKLTRTSFAEALDRLLKHIMKAQVK